MTESLKGFRLMTHLPPNVLGKYEDPTSPSLAPKTAKASSQKHHKENASECRQGLVEGPSPKPRSGPPQKQDRPSMGHPSTVRPIVLHQLQHQVLASAKVGSAVEAKEDVRTVWKTWISKSTSEKYNGRDERTCALTPLLLRH